MNTAIAAMMTAVNEMTANGVTRGDLGILLRLLNPFAPHITEELWEQLGFAAKTGKMCCQAEWPVYDAAKTVASSVEMAIQVNGKMKGTGITVMIVSNNRSGVRVTEFCGDLGIGYQGHAGKPSPKGLRAAMERTGADPAHTAMLGDKLLTDMLAAHRAGVRAWMVEPLGGPVGLWNHILHLLQRPFKRACPYKCQKNPGENTK